MCLMRKQGIASIPLNMARNIFLAKSVLKVIYPALVPTNVYTRIMCYTLECLQEFNGSNRSTRVKLNYMKEFQGFRLVTLGFLSVTMMLLKK